MTVIDINGVHVHKGLLNRADQERLRDAIREVVKVAPLVRMVTPSGKPMSVQMTSAGRFGWVSDARGYRYADRHPSGVAWPDIPGQVLDLWNNLAEVARVPECCLVNYYADGAKMGLHQDKDEANFDYPVLSISLGDAALFRVGQQTRGGKTQSIWLESGDVAIMAGAARLKYHGIDRIKAGSSTLLRNGGRINLTCRVVT